jgi:lipopolysaccharide/colanic/teichoic acid biosynthesis glycosyltransferase
MYANFFKRPIDFCCAFAAILCLSPVLVVLTVLGAIKMKGNPFFTQPRPGKNEKIFKLIKFRTMTCEKDADGKLLPDEKRLTKYGKFIRSTSLDELPELFNILKGDMAVIGPRPLLVEYLPRYNSEQKHRHDVRPGLSGLAQVNGRNAITWEQKFKYDVEYVNNVTFLGDVKIILTTLKKAVKREGISGAGAATMTAFIGTPESEQKSANG